MKYDKHKAVTSLKPTSEWNWKGFDYANFNWISSDTKPTESEIDAEVIRLQAIEDYQAPRRAEYPSIGDQLDMIYHNGDGGATFQAAIKAVKDKYPKE